MKKGTFSVCKLCHDTRAGDIPFARRVGRRVFLHLVLLAALLVMTDMVSAAESSGPTPPDSPASDRDRDSRRPGHPPPSSKHPPKAPSGLRAEALSDSQIRVTWADKSDNETGFQLERAQGQGRYQRIATLPANTTTYLDRDLCADTRYCYRVRALNARGPSDYSRKACAHTPKAPTNCPLVVSAWGSFPIIPPVGLGDVVAVASGSEVGLALRSDGTVASWGYGSTLSRLPPANLTNVVAIAAGYLHGVALKKNGTVMTWGAEFYPNIRQPENLNEVTAIAAGGYHSLALKRDGTVVGWGYNYSGQASPPTNLSGVMLIAAGDNYSVAMRTNGSLVSWGAVPFEMPERLTNAVSIALGSRFGLALLRDGSVAGWPSSENGGIELPAGLTNIVAISACGENYLALRQDGTLIGRPQFSNPPSNLKGVTAISAGLYFNLALSATLNPPYAFAPLVTGSNQVTLVWTNDPIARATVHIERANAEPYPSTNSDWKLIATVSSGSTTFTDRTVTAGRSYLYRARSVGACATSVDTYWQEVTIAAPTQTPYLYASAFADEAHITTYPPFGGSTGVRIQRAPDVSGSPGDWSVVLTTNTTDALSHSFADTGLMLGKRYWYRSQFFNGLGDSPFSDPASVDILSPGAPSYFDAFIARNRRIVLIWNPPPANDQAGYNLERTTNILNGTEVWSQIAIVSNQLWQPYHEDADVEPGQSYSYRVRSFNQLGNSPFTTPLTVALTGPPPPDLYAYPFADEARVYWYLNYPGEVERFILQRAPDNAGVPGAWAQIAELEGYNNYYSHYADRGREPGSTNWYRVQAINWTGASPFSAPKAVVIVPPNVPELPVARIGSSNTVVLSWYAGYPQDQDGFLVERASDLAGVPGAWSHLGTVLGTNASSAIFEDVAVLANTTNWYRVQAFNRAGVSPYSGSVRVEVVPPPIPWVTVGNFADQIHLSWSGDYASYGRVDGFEIERASDSSGAPGTWIPWATVIAPTNTYADEHLPLDAKYWYRVRAYNWVGASLFSDPENATIIPPSAPYYLSGSIQTNGVRLRWLPGGAGDQDGFRVERANDASGSPGSWTVIATNVTLPHPMTWIGFEFTDSNAVARATNWYRFQAFNHLGSSPYSTLLPVNVRPPPAPRSLNASSFADRANLSWSTDYYDYGAVSGYKLERALDAGGQPGVWTPVATLADPWVGYYQDTGLTGNLTYWYRLRSYNWVGDGDYSDPVSVSIVPPVPPYGLSVLIGETNRAHLHWWTPSPYDAEQFEIEKAGDVSGQPGTWTKLATILASNRYEGILTDTNVSANTTHWYRVRAINPVGVSEYCPAANLAVVRPEPPSSLSTFTFADDISLAWQHSYPAQAGTKIGMKIERATDAGGVPGAWQQIAVINFDLPVWTMSLADSNRPTGVTQWYRVRAFNWVGDSDYSDAASATVLPPLKPFPPVAYVGGTNQVELSLTTPPPADQDGFRLERATDVVGVPGAWTEIAVVTNSDTGLGYLFVDTNVLAFTTNWYRVRSYNSVGLSDYSDGTRIALVPPPSPADLNATATANRIALWWNSRSSEYGLIQGFELERALDAGGIPGTWQRLVLLTDFSNQYTDAGLTADTTYWYRLRSFNWIGWSDYCAPVKATIQPPPPPQLLSASLGNTNRAQLSWYAGSPPDQDGFRVERASDVAGVPGDWFEIGLVGSTNSWYGSFTDTNALPFTTNWYRVRAFNVAGDSAYCPAIRLAVVPPPQVPLPTTSSFADRIRVSWQEVVQATGLLGYKVERAVETGAGIGPWQLLDTTSRYDTDTVDTGLSLNVAYWYRVTAFNWVGDGLPSPAVRAYIRPPNPVAWVRAIIGSPRGVTLMWYATYPYDQDGYRIERADTGDWREIAVIGATNVSFNVVFSDTNVLPNVTYRYRVQAFNRLGNSGYSPVETIATVPPPAPAFVQAQPFANTMQLGWAGPSSDYGVVAQFEIDQAQDAGGLPGTWQTVTNVPSAVRNLTIPGLTATTYWYRVRMANWTGLSPYSVPVSATIIPPTSPYSLRASVATITNTAEILWSASHPRDQDGFRVECAPDYQGAPGDWSELAVVPGTNSYSGYFVHTNVSAFSTNWYRVRSFNVVGNSAYTPPVALAIVPPPAPPYLTAAPFANRIELRWDTYYHNPIEGFQLERAADVSGVPGSWTPLAKLSRFNGEFLDTNRPPGSTWWYRLRAFNWVGAGEFTAPVSATIVPPGNPYDLRLYVGFTNQTQLEWRAAFPADQWGFYVERADDADGSPGAWQQIAVHGATNQYYVLFADSNVMAFTTNWYRVRAFNNVGESAPSDPAVIRVVPPRAPRYFYASAFADRANLSWEYNYYDYGHVPGFRIERAPDAGGGPGTWTPLATTGEYVNYFADTNLATGATYWYRVQAVNWVGAGDFSWPSNVTIVPPAAPRNVYAEAVATNYIAIFWSAGPPTDQDGYFLERSTDALSSWIKLATVPASNQSYSWYHDTAFIPNVTNYYRLRAFNAVGVSSYSSVVGAFISKAVTASEDPPALRLTSLTLTNADVLISWSAPAGIRVVLEASQELNGAFVPLGSAAPGATNRSYLDAGALTNSPARFYRLRATP